MRVFATTDEVRQVAYAANGRTLVTVEGDRSGLPRVNWWDLREGQSVRSLILPGAPRSVAAATSRPSPLIAYLDDDQIVVVDQFGQTAYTIPTRHSPSALAMTPEGNWLAFSTIQNYRHPRSRITLEWLEERDWSREFYSNTRVQQLTFDPGGGSLISAGAGQFTVWDLNRKESVMARAVSDIGAMVYSNNGAYFAMATGRRITVWSNPRESIVATFDPGECESITAMAFSPDGRTLAFCRRTLGPFRRHRYRRHSQDVRLEIRNSICNRFRSGRAHRGRWRRWGRNRLGYRRVRATPC